MKEFVAVSINICPLQDPKQWGVKSKVMRKVDGACGKSRWRNHHAPLLDDNPDNPIKLVTYSLIKIQTVYNMLRL